MPRASSSPLQLSSHAQPGGMPGATGGGASPPPPATALIVDTALMMISGAAEPNAMNEAPATSSRTPLRTQSVSRLQTRWSSATMATAVKA